MVRFASLLLLVCYEWWWGFVYIRYRNTGHVTSSGEVLYKNSPHVVFLDAPSGNVGSMNLAPGNTASTRYIHVIAGVSARLGDLIEDFPKACIGGIFPQKLDKLFCCQVPVFRVRLSVLWQTYAENFGCDSLVHLELHRRYGLPQPLCRGRR